MSVQALEQIEKIGEKRDTIHVRLSYRIIELFSGGLYSSPNKAIEELVANSYDAYASRVHIILSANLKGPDAFIAVVDDGESMNLQELHDLWLIAGSTKRDKPPRGRLPIGKFGIGKLATYVLATKLTHVCKKDGRYLTVTMDYGRIPPTGIATEAEPIKDFLELAEDSVGETSIPVTRTATEEEPAVDVLELAKDDIGKKPVPAAKVTTETELAMNVLELTEDDAREMLSFLDRHDPTWAEVIPLFDSTSPQTWTVCIMSNLKDMAQELKVGRLEWILSTAMPLTPDFVTYLNGRQIEPSRVRTSPRILEWTIGKDDKVATERLNLECVYRKDAPEDQQYRVVLPTLGEIWGKVEIYEDTLTGGKSERLQRSYGFFIMVRDRLINIDDPLFGLTPLSHKTFNRFRMVVYCDGLDDYLRSTRESIVQIDAVEPFYDYLRKKFNEAADAYERWLGEKEREIRLTTRIHAVPRGLARRPLFNLVRDAVEGKIDPPRLTRLPMGLTEREKGEFLAKLQNALESESGLIEDVDFEDLAYEDGIAIFDAFSGRVKVNRSHPFYANYEESFQDPEPFKLLGVAEILTEAFLIEEGVDSFTVRTVLERRDRFLRELIYSRRLNAKLAAQLLRDAGDHEQGLEKAAHTAFQSLGFDVQPLGGKGKPDGIAHARLGIRTGTGASANYKAVYDAKSTTGKRVQTTNINMGEAARHKKDYSADFAVIIAKDFADTKGEEAAVIKEARQQRVTLVRTSDLAALIEAAAVKRLGYDQVRKLFEECITADEVHNWVQAFISEPPERGPIPNIIQAVYELQNEHPEAVNTTAVYMHLKHQDKLSGLTGSKDVERWIQVVSRLVPEYVSIRDDLIELNTRPDLVLRHCGQQLRELAETPHREAMLKSLQQPKDG